MYLEDIYTHFSWVGLQYHMANVFDFVRDSYTRFQTVPIYSPTTSVIEFQLFHILITV